MTTEQQEHLVKAHEKLLRAVTDYFHACDRSKQYPYNDVYKQEVVNKKNQLRRLAKSENLERGKSTSEIAFNG